MKQSLNIKSTREAKVGMELLDTNIKVLPLLQSIPVVSYKYKDQPNGSEIKSQIGILAEDTFYQANPTETNTPFNPPPGGGTALSGFPYQPLGKTREYKPNPNIKYTLKTGSGNVELEKRSTYLKAILDQANKGQNIISSVGLLLKGIQEITDRVMCLENQILGDDFISGWAQQTSGQPGSLNVSDIDQKVIPHGLARVVKALSKNVFGEASPGKEQLEKTLDNGSLAEIADIKIRLNQLGDRMATLEQNITSITTDIGEIKTGISELKSGLLNGFGGGSPGNLPTLKQVIGGIPGAINGHTTAAVGGVTTSINQSLEKIQGESPLNDAITLKNIIGYLSKLNNHGQPVEGTISGAAKYVKSGTGGHTCTLTFDNAKVTFNQMPFITKSNG